MRHFVVPAVHRLPIMERIVVSWVWRNRRFLIPNQGAGQRQAEDDS